MVLTNLSAKEIENKENLRNKHVFERAIST